MTDLEISSLCCSLPPFCNLSDDDLRSVLEKSRRREFANKECIFFEGDQGEAGYLVLSGRVAMVKNSARGREMIVELLPAGELFGIVAFIDERPYPLTARAQSDTEVLVIPRSAVSNLAKSSPGILQGFLAVVSDRLQTAHNVARSLAHDKVEVRIASALLALLEKGKTTVQIGRQELADLTGTTIESASRICKLWEKDGMLDLSTHGVVTVNNRLLLDSIAADGSV